jgi:uncharacterized protein (DUF4415 family)
MRPVTGSTDEKELRLFYCTGEPFARQLKRQVTLRSDRAVVEYFQRMSGSSGVKYQSLINLYLRDCVSSLRTLAMRWPRKTG